MKIFSKDSHAFSSKKQMEEQKPWTRFYVTFCYIIFFCEGLYIKKSFPIVLYENLQMLYITYILPKKSYSVFFERMKMIWLT